MNQCRKCHAPLKANDKPYMCADPEACAMRASCSINKALAAQEKQAAPPGYEGLTEAEQHAVESLLSIAPTSKEMLATGSVPDIEVACRAALRLNDLVNTKNRRLAQSPRPCPECEGSGELHDFKSYPCTVCRGTGQQEPPKPADPCPKCGGILGDGTHPVGTPRYRYCLSLCGFEVRGELQNPSCPLHMSSQAPECGWCQRLGEEARALLKIPCYCAETSMRNCPRHQNPEG
jgi:hypothetical protein